MRAVDLGKIAAEAEKIRLQQLMNRQIRRGVYFFIAALFALFMLAMIHVLLWQVLAEQVGPIWASTILLVVDLVIAAISGIVGSRSAPSQVEKAAADVRHEALKQAGEAMSFMVLLPTIRSLGGRKLRSGLEVVGLLGRTFK